MGRRTVETTSCDRCGRVRTAIDHHTKPGEPNVERYSIPQWARHAVVGVGRPPELSALTRDIDLCFACAERLMEAITEYLKGPGEQPVMPTDGE